MEMGGLFDFGIALRLGMASNCGIWIFGELYWIGYTQIVQT
jgi:hypothetical protein